MRKRATEALSWAITNWYQLSVIILLLLIVQLLNSSLSDIEAEVADVNDGIEVEIVDSVDPILPGWLPNIEI